MHEHLIVGLKGLSLTDQERIWLHEKPPLGNGAWHDLWAPLE